MNENKLFTASMRLNTACRLSSRFFHCFGLCLNVNLLHVKLQFRRKLIIFCKKIQFILSGQHADCLLDFVITWWVFLILLMGLSYFWNSFRLLCVWCIVLCVVLLVYVCMYVCVYFVSSFKIIGASCFNIFWQVFFVLMFFLKKH